MGLTLESAPWDHSTYSKNRNRLIEHEVKRELFERVLDRAREAGLLSAEHFSVDGTLVRAWASHRSNDTHRRCQAARYVAPSEAARS